MAQQQPSQNHQENNEFRASRQASFRAVLTTAAGGGSEPPLDEVTRG
jgi:hypothetical protein